MLGWHQIKDIAERALSTYIQSVIGILLAANITDFGDGVSTVRAAAVSAIPAVLSVVKGWLAATLPFGDDSAGAVDLSRPGGLAAEEDLYQ